VPIPSQKRVGFRTRLRDELPDIQDFIDLEIGAGRSILIEIFWSNKFWSPVGKGIAECEGEVDGGLCMELIDSGNSRKRDGGGETKGGNGNSHPGGIDVNAEPFLSVFSWHGRKWGRRQVADCDRVCDF
jgi:hypothetical protein